MEEEKVNTEADITPVIEQIEGLVEVITEQQEVIKQEQEKSLVEQEEEQLLIEQQEEEQLLEEKELEQEKQLEKEEETQFREQVLTALSVEPIDYTPHLIAITESLDTLKENQNYISESDHVINLYGLILIPLIVAVYGLWKMIKGFI